MIHMRLFVVLFVLVAFTSVYAQDTNSVQPSQPLTSFVKINGQRLQAKNYEEFVQLKNMVIAINEMRRLRSEGRMLKEDYEKAVATLLKKAETNGITIY